MSKQPHLPHKKNLPSQPLLTAQQRLAILESEKAVPACQPKTVILCMDNGLFFWASRRWRATRTAGFFGQTALPRAHNGHTAIVGGVGVGAPVISVLVEDWAAHGVAQIVLLGTAAILSPIVAASDIITINSAIGHDAVSRTYGDSQTIHHASSTLITHLTKHPTLQKQARTCTVSTPYRTTTHTIQTALAQEASLLEMEAAALFSVGTAVGIQTAAVVVTADSFATGKWQQAPAWHSIQHALRIAYQAVLDCLPH